LLFAERSEVRIEGKLDTDQGAFVGPGQSSNITASSIIFYVNGINGGAGNLGSTPKAAQLGMNNTIHANFYVINGTLWIRQGTTATGAFFARDVDIGKNVEITKDSFFEKPNPGLSKIQRYASRTVDAVIPETFGLSQNYPNPFNPDTNIRIKLPEDARVEILIFNVLGRRVRTLINTDLSAGNHLFRWDGTDDKGSRVSSGVYFYKIVASSFSATKKMMLLQ
jgi:hypothetical protein